MFPVPNGLPPEVATLTEPMAVGWHAVRRAEVNKKTVTVVIGCGPVGLAVILFLKAQGVRTVIASDFSPARRDARDAAAAPTSWSIRPRARRTRSSAGRDLLEDMPAALELAVGLGREAAAPAGRLVARLAARRAARARRAEAPGDLRVRRRPRA